MNSTTKTIIYIIIALIIIYVGYSLLKSSPAEEGPIKIGLSSPMTGEAASYGEAFSAGAELAVQEINDAGGINDRPIELIIEDDTCSADGASVINKLVNIDKVVALAGPLCSAAAGPGVPIAQEIGIPTIVVGSAPHLTKTGDFIFRNYPSDAFQGKFAADFISNNLGKTKIAVLYTKNDWGQGIRDVFVPQIEKLGGEIVYEEGISQDARDIRTQLTKLKEANPEVIYTPLYPQTAAAGLKQIQELEINIPIIGGDAFVGEEVLKAEGAEGVMYTVAESGELETFMAKVQQETGKNTNAFTPYSYDAIKILARVIEKAGTDPEAIKAELAGLRYTDGVSSPIIEFDSQGDLKEAEFVVKVIKNGEPVDYQK